MDTKHHQQPSRPSRTSLPYPPHWAPLRSGARTRGWWHKLALLFAAPALFFSTDAHALIGYIPVLYGSGTGCAGGCSFTYDVYQPTVNLGYYLYAFNLTIDSINSLEIPLLAPSLLITGSGTVTGGTDPTTADTWTATVVTPTDPSWDWGFTTTNSAKLAYQNVPAVLRFTGQSLVGTASNPIAFAYRSSATPTHGPYGIDLASNAPTYVDPPIPGTNVPEPGTLALVGAGLVLIARLCDRPAKRRRV